MVLYTIPGLSADLVSVLIAVCITPSPSCVYRFLGRAVELDVNDLEKFQASDVPELM